MAKKQRDFNADLGDYLDKRKGPSSGGFFSFFSVEASFSKKSPGDRVPRVSEVGTTVVDRPAKKSWLSRLFSSSKSVPEDFDADDLPEDVREEVVEMEDDIEELDREMHELEDKRESLLTRFFSLIRGRRSRKVAQDIDPDTIAHAIGDHARNEAVIADTRVVLRSVHYWLGKLPPEQIDAFKRSPDFQRYKDLLDKYGLIK